MTQVAGGCPQLETAISTSMLGQVMLVLIILNVMAVIGESMAWVKKASASASHLFSSKGIFVGGCSAHSRPVLD